MTAEILFPEVCTLYGDSANADYLAQSVKDINIVKTPITDEPYFAENDVDMILIGPMTENIQRRVIEKLMPYKGRLAELINAGKVILATGNAADIFTKHITYVTEEKETDALAFFDLEVTVDWFNRTNEKFIGEADGLTIVGFKSRFSQIFGDNSSYAFAKAERGTGINLKTPFEGMRQKNLICTTLIGPLLPLNPAFTRYLVALTGNEAEPAFEKEAVSAYEKRVREFRDPKVVFHT